MNTRPTYFAQRERVIQAYLKEELNPFHPSFCFCGNLCSNNSKWYGETENAHFDYNGYKGYEFVRMEKALLKPLHRFVNGLTVDKSHPDYEEQLFKGLCAAIDELKKIHRSRGENVEDETIPLFEKRQVAN